jgi:hypothetical protein
MPDYNFGFNAPLKNALDFLQMEWQYKPVGLVSYGGVSAGTRAAQMLKQVVTALKMTPLAEAVSIPFVAQFLDDDGEIRPNEVMEHSRLRRCWTSWCGWRGRSGGCGGRGGRSLDCAPHDERRHDRGHALPVFALMLG